MEKIVVFFCDIVGTYYDSRETTDRKINLLRLKNNLEMINNIEQTSKLIFSFITTDSMSFLTYHLVELNDNIIGKNIILGNQYANDGFLKEGLLYNRKMHFKYEAIKEYIEYIKEIYNLVIYYADDQILNHILTRLNVNDEINELLIGTTSDDIEYNTMSYGLDGLNDTLEKVITKTKTNYELKFIS